MMTEKSKAPDMKDAFPPHPGTEHEQLLPQLVAHLREHRSRLRQEWAGRILDSHLLQAMTPQEMAAETTSVYDNYVEVLETGSVEALQHYARDLSERLTEVASGAGFTPDRKPLRAHLTLARKVRADVARNFEWPRAIATLRVRCERFVLMESRRGEAGSTYSVVDSWPLYEK